MAGDPASLQLLPFVDLGKTLGNAYTANWSMAEQLPELIGNRAVPGGTPFIPTSVSPARPDQQLFPFSRAKASRARQSKPRALSLCSSAEALWASSSKETLCYFSFCETGREQREAWSRSEWPNSISQPLARDQPTYRRSFAPSVSQWTCKGQMKSSSAFRRCI